MSKVREYHLNDPTQELDDLAYWRERSVEGANPDAVHRALSTRGEQPSDR